MQDMRYCHFGESLEFNHEFAILLATLGGGNIVTACQLMS